MERACFKIKQADVCKTFTSRPFRIPGTAAPITKTGTKEGQLTQRYY